MNVLTARIKFFLGSNVQRLKMYFLSARIPYFCLTKPVFFSFWICLKSTLAANGVINVFESVIKGVSFLKSFLVCLDMEKK